MAKVKNMDVFLRGHLDYQAGRIYKDIGIMLFYYLRNDKSSLGLQNRLYAKVSL